MKQFLHGWTPGLIVAAAVTLTGAAYGQQATQPASDPYQGVSQPPPDDSIVANPDAAPAPPPTAVVSKPAYNPDDDIVGSSPVASPAQYSDPAPNSAVLETRPSETRPNPDAGIVSVIPSSGNELPEGTNVRVRLTERLSTVDTTAGSPFRGEVTTAVFKDGRIIIPPGSILKGRVISVRQGHHFTGAATLHLRPDMILLPDGTAYHLYAQVIQSKAPGTRTDSEGGIQPSSQWKKDTAEYGVGIGAGAIAGAHFAGPHGALIGAGIGATVITAHLLMQHPAAAVVPSGSVVTFSLSEPMELTPTRN
ncbi:hypothetical protein HNQ77_002163 [Silvibacterium bohemicum]|uniref:TrbI/VirB10 family protein n=1 Tax=Silvibacterium bohemicum TaxID=1577686 RepID=A0A841JZ25_9BACT|nr:hypothetical protein [Silvibacterium bohemicum]MBB6144211.1 hypothetical protein [Silvibacterium bohemicum]